ncbi:glycosyltransferase family 4 protein [Aliifodinibius salicampi]|uniref:Glycosyltransferase family 4 protein n=1 Tax=Fodinibius salicampi TaxID=1920655 RepID=A0ABT3PV54_9BACT|nr:glycosyltransferase family 1 protein [Fodinibius salicampi]MCW9711723.1 glycosyltransferase family 4 protein [Fodinibius salicampi]
MIRVGIDASNIISGGGLTHLVEILNNVQIDKVGIDSIEVWASQNTLSFLPEKEGVVLRHHPWLDQNLLKRGLWQRFKLTAVARDHYDLLFVPGGSYLGSFRPFVTMNRNLQPFDQDAIDRYSWSPQKLRIQLLSVIQKYTYKQAEGVIFLSDEARKITLENLDRVSFDTRIVPHGIAQKFFKKPRIQKPIGEYSFTSPMRLLYVSTINLYKHQWNVIETVAHLREKGYPVVLDLIGNIKNKQAGKRFWDAVKKYDPNNEFIFYHGSRDQDQLIKDYHNADIAVFASSCETFGQILLESMASGLPVACADRSAMPEILQESGVYFDPENVSSLIDALEKYIGDTELRNKMAHSAYKRARNFSWDKCAEDTFSYLSQITKQYYSTN